MKLLDKVTTWLKKMFFPFGSQTWIMFGLQVFKCTRSARFWYQDILGFDINFNPLIYCSTLCRHEMLHRIEFSPSLYYKLFQNIESLISKLIISSELVESLFFHSPKFHAQISWFKTKANYIALGIYIFFSYMLSFRLCRMPIISQSLSNFVLEFQLIIS